MSRNPYSAGLLAVIAASSLAAGCSGLATTDMPNFENIHQQLADAQREPKVRQHAGSLLTDAGYTLAQAQRAYNDPARARHLAYMAQRKVAVARSMAMLTVTAEQLNDLASRGHPSADAAHASLTVQSPPAARDARKGRIAARKPVVSDPGTTRVSFSRPRTEEAVRPAEKVVAKATPIPEAEGSSHPETLGDFGEMVADLRKDRERPWAVIGLDSLFAGAEIDRLSPRASRDLAPLVRYLGADKESAVVVEGFAIGYDNRKKELEWSSHAAEAVKSHLVGQGVDGRRILVLGRVVDAAQPDRGQPAEDLQERIEVHLFGAASETTPTSPGAANLPYP